MTASSMFSHWQFWLSELFPYFHYPTSKSKESSRLRQITTDRYGYITTIIVALFILSIPIHAYLHDRGWSPLGRVSYLRRLNRHLNAFIYPGQHLTQRPNWWRRLQTTLASSLKAWMFYISYHSNTIFVILFWTIVLTSLSFAQINHGDLIYLAKRLGKVATVCLPTILFLTLRPSPLPRTLYLSLLPIHKWLSRLIIIQVIAHTALYCGYFNLKNTWFKAWKSENLWGWAAAAGLCTIALTSLSKIRNRFYKLFYFNHYVCSWLIVICLQFHVRPTKITWYTVANIAILGGQIAHRIWITRITPTPQDLKVTAVSPNLSLIEFPNKLVAKRSVNPGAHIRICEYYPSWISRAYSQLIPNYHPYTLASLPQDNFQKLIVKSGTFQMANNRKYLICGSYDPHLLFITSKNRASGSFSLSKLKVGAKRVLIVIGGSAISFALPILRVMNYHGIPVKIVWVIKDYRDVNVLRYFDGYIHGDDFEIFVTGDHELNDHTGLRHASSWHSSFFTSDLERNESDPLLPPDSTTTRNDNDENVDISVDIPHEEESSDDDSCHDCANVEDTHSLESQKSVTSFAGEPTEPVEPLSRVPSNKSASYNEPFIPVPGPHASDTTRSHIQQFMSCVQNLNLQHKIYRGRPTLNYKYYNWCLNEGFTQCSGPVHDESNNLVCCRDLPKNKVRQEDIDAEKIWVISAGPQSLVKNVKLWAKEYGLKFHEEAFNI